MTTTERSEPQVEGNGTEPKPAARTLLEQVRQQLEHDLGEETLDLRLPRRQPRLVARYRVIDDQDEVKTSDVIGTNVSMLTQACIGLFVLDGDGELEPLELDGRPVTYATAHEALGLGTETARDTLLKLFKENKIAFLEHADRVATWMTDTSQEVEGQVLGESSA